MVSTMIVNSETLPTPIRALLGLAFAVLNVSFAIRGGQDPS